MEVVTRPYELRASQSDSYHPPSTAKTLSPLFHSCSASVLGLSPAGSTRRQQSARGPRKSFIRCACGSNASFESL